MLLNRKEFNAVFMIVGTAVGAGMLGMPVESGPGGAPSSIFYLIITWAITLSTALLFARVISISKLGSNYVTISENLLRVFAQYV